MKDRYQSFLSLASSRKSCRRFSPEPIPQEDIDRILQAASHSPFASGRSSWKIAVVTDRQKIARLAQIVSVQSEELASKMDADTGDFFRKYARSFTFFKDAGALMIPYCRESSTMKSILRENVTDELLVWERDNLTKSLSCVAMMILLAAESLDLGACYMTGPLVAGKKLNQELEIRDNFILGAIIPIGFKLSDNGD